MLSGRLNMLVAVCFVQVDSLILVRQSFLEKCRSPGTRSFDDSTFQTRDSRRCIK